MGLVVKKGLKIFKERGVCASMKEMKQLHTRDCFGLLHIEQLTESEKKKIVDAIMLLQEKRDKTIKGR